MEVRQVRTDEIKLIKIDEPAANIRYIGRSSSIRGTDSEAIWQIQRQYKSGNVITNTYANMGSFTASWTDRVSYFSDAIADNNNPLDIEVSGAVSTAGQKNIARFTEITVNSTTWTPIPASSLIGRNALSIQNQGTADVKINTSASEAGYKGMKISPSGERFYDISANITLYAKSASGNQVLGIEEIS